MQLRALGRSGLSVSPLCLGGNVFGWTADEATSHALLDRYAAAGGNFIDTANVYSSWVPGHVAANRRASSAAGCARAASVTA
jgi:aryl-alcohol dehydrogenase-like predicted oxidoreductase